MKPKPTLRRSVTPWGSFSWGYSDVGADIFVGLGLVLGAAGGGSSVAFLFAGIVPGFTPRCAAISATDNQRSCISNRSLPLQNKNRRQTG